jgi:hypothetical protein
LKRIVSSLLTDRPLQLIGIAWAILFALGVYTA